MAALIHDRGRGPEIVGTRITVADLLPHFFDETVTETYICGFYELTPAQVAAARAYAVKNPDTVLLDYQENRRRVEAAVEAQAKGNGVSPPLVAPSLDEVRAKLRGFKEWLAEREAAEAREAAAEGTGPDGRRTEGFTEWLAARQARAVVET